MDASDFQRGVTGLNRQMKLMQSQFKLARSELGANATELDRLKLKSQEYTKKVQIQEQMVKELEEAHRKSVETKGADSRATQNLEARLNSARTRLNYMNQDLKNVNNEVANYGTGIKAINSKMKVLESEFKLVSSAIGDQASELDKLKLKSQEYSNKVQLQEQIVNELEQAHRESAEAKGLDARETQELAVELNSARTALNNTQRDLRNTNSEISNYGTGLKALNRQMNVLESEFQLASSAIGIQASELDRLKLKSQEYSNKVQLQEQIVNELEQAHRESAEAKGLDARETQELAVELNNARASLNNMQHELEETNADITQQESRWNILGNRLSQAGDQFRAVGKKMSEIGQSMTTKVTMPIVGAGVAMYNLGGKFEEGAKKISTIADNSVVSIANMKKSVLELSDDVGTSTDELNEAVYQTISATEDTANAVDYVKVSAMAAIGGFTETSVAVDGLTTVMNSYGLKGKEAMQAVSDQMLQAQNVGKTTFGEMAQGLGDVIPLTSSLNVSTGDLFASIATLTKNGIQTSKAITGLKAAYSNIIKPSKQAGELAAEIGLEFNSAHLKSVGWAKFLDEIREKTGGNTDQMAQLFGSVEALNTVTVLATTGSKDFASALDSMENSAGATQRAFEKMDEGGTDSLEDTMNSIKNLGTTLGLILLPHINALLDKVKEWVDGFKNMDEGSQRTALKIAGVAAAIGPLLMIGGKLVTGIGALMSAFSTVSTAIGVATGAVTTASGAAGALGAAFTVLTGPVGLAVAGIAALTAGGIALHRHLSKDSIPAIERFGDEISESTKKAVGGFLDLNDEATKALDELNWSGQAVSAETASAIASNFNGMADKITAEYEKMATNSTEQLNNLFKNSKTIAESEQKSIIESIQKSSEERCNTIQSEKDRVNEILNQAKEEHRALTELEQTEINNIQRSMVDNGIVVLTDSEREQKVIFEKMYQNASDLSALQAAEVVRNAQKQKEEVITEAENQYDKVVAEIIKQRDEVGSLSTEQADKLIAEALRQKNDTISHAEDMHLKIVSEAKKQAGDHVKQVNWETGEIKSKWEAWKDDLADTLSKSWEYQKKGFKDSYESIKKSTTEFGKKVSETWSDIKKDIVKRWESVENYLSKIDLKEIGKNIIDGLINGITSKWEDLKTSVGNLGESIKTKFTDLLDIHSPSRVFRGYGENIVEGLNEGIEDSKESLKIKMKELADLTASYAESTIGQIRKIQQAKLNLDAMMTGGAGGDQVLPIGLNSDSFYYGRPDKQSGYSGSPGGSSAIGVNLSSRQRNIDNYVDEDGKFDKEKFYRLVKRVTTYDIKDSELSESDILKVAQQLDPYYRDATGSFTMLRFRKHVEANLKSIRKAYKKSREESDKDVKENEKDIDAKSKQFEDLSKNLEGSMQKNIKVFENGFANIDGIISSRLSVFRERLKSYWDETTANNETNMDKVVKLTITGMDKVSDRLSLLFEQIEAWNELEVKSKTFEIVETIRKVSSNRKADIDRNFSGTSFFRGGLTMVGELGPELVKLPRGSKIYDNNKTSKMLGGKTEINQSVNIYSPEPLSPSKTAKKLKQAARELAFNW
jgi:TP901 family phage tail tape measure protein